MSDERSHRRPPTAPASPGDAPSWPGLLIITGANEYLAVGNQGWVYFHRLGGHDVRLRLSRNDAGRLVVRTVVLNATNKSGRQSSDSAISASDLRDLPLGKLETILNSPDNTSAMLDAIQSQSGVDFGPDGCPAAQAREVAERLPVRAKTGLRVEDSSTWRRSDDFYRRVGAAFASAMALGPRPAEALAEANGVATSTVHRWIKEARKRGVLPPVGGGRQ